MATARSARFQTGPETEPPPPASPPRHHAEKALETPETAAGSLETLNRIMSASKMCFVVTHSANGLHGRPMSVAQLDISKQDTSEALYFITHRSTTKVEEIHANPGVALLFADPHGHTWASITANATVVDDKQRVRDMWQKEYATWFPDGPDSPDIAVIRAVPSCGSYWEGPGLNKLPLLFSTIKAKVTGKPVAGMPAQGEAKAVVFPAGAAAAMAAVKGTAAGLAAVATATRTQGTTAEPAGPTVAALERDVAGDTAPTTAAGGAAHAPPMPGGPAAAVTGTPTTTHAV